MLQLQSRAGESGRPARRTASIFVDLAGGPTQFDTCAPKPDASVEYRGAFGVTQTNCRDVTFRQLMPKHAGICEKRRPMKSIESRCGITPQAVPASGRAEH